MTPNGVILVTVNPTEIAILSFMHGAKISIRVSIWSFEQEIIRPHTSLFIVVAIDVLLHWNWHEALSNIMIIPFGRARDTRFRSAILDLLIFEIVHAVYVDSLRWELLDWLCDKTFVVLLLLLLGRALL